MVCLALGAGQAMPAPAARFPRNVHEYQQMFEEIKNWERWGGNDQLGAANLITDEKRKQALTVAKLGRVFGLAHPLLKIPAADNPYPFEQIMDLRSAEFALDTYKVFYHGPAHTHLDALCHAFFEGKTYNGYPAREVSTATGCTRLGVENLKNGVVTRGVLIDIPRLRGIPYLEPGTPVLVEDLEAWEKKVGIRVSSGDAIVLRTGRWSRRAMLGPWDMNREAGLHASVAPWLKARGVAFIGSDDSLDVLPSLVEGVEMPVHTLVIAALGIAVLDNLDLETMAATASGFQRWEFLLTFAPLPVPGGTGSPVDALAIF